MRYISQMQYDMLSEHLTIKTVVEDEHNLYVEKMLFNYQCDSVMSVKSDEVIGYILVFEYFEKKFYVLDILEAYKDILFDTLDAGDCLILNKNQLVRIIENEKDSFDIYDDSISQIVLRLKSHAYYTKKIKVGPLCNIDIHSSDELSNDLIDDYVSELTSGIPSNELNVYSVSNDLQFFALKTLYNTIQFFYQIRLANSPKLLSEGNSYRFFSIGKFIVGVQKYFNYIDSPLTYYIFDSISNSLYVVSLFHTAEQALRSVQAYIAYSNQVANGINLHASALVYGNHTIMLTGKKESGKTTNILFGLKCNPNVALMSNDIVHLCNINGATYAIGSPRKMTIRPATVQLFDELKDSHAQQVDIYDSLGKKNSSPAQKVKTIKNVAMLFDRSVVSFAFATIVVGVTYDDNVDDVDIEELYGTDAIECIVNNVHDYYNGREKFWNEIFGRGTKECNLNMLKGIRVFKAKVNQKNILNTWKYIFNIIDREHSRL